MYAAQWREESTRSLRKPRDAKYWSVLAKFADDGCFAKTVEKRL